MNSKQKDRLLNSTLRTWIKALAESKDSLVLIDYADIKDLETGEYKIFFDAGFIIPFASARSMICTGCEEACFMPVYATDTSAFIVCETFESMGRTAVNPNDLKRWAFSFDTLTSVISGIIDSTIHARTLIPDICAYAGNCQIAYGLTDVFLVKNTENELTDIADIRQSPRYILLCLNDIPDNMPAINILTALLFQNGKPTFNIEAVEKVLSSQKPAAHENLFRRTGDTWTVQFQGQSCTVKHTNGMLYLAQLLQHPHQPIHVTQLEQIIGRIAIFENPLDDLKNDAGNKSRNRVREAVKAAKNNISKAGHPVLSLYLQSSIKTGFDCMYQPQNQKNWQIFSDAKS